MRRQQYYNTSHLLAYALREIERIQALNTRVTDGRVLVITPGSGGGSGGTTPGIEPAAHVLYGSKHSKALAVRIGAGLSVDFDEGHAVIDAAYYSIAAGNLAGLANGTTNYVFVDHAGAVNKNTTGFPLNGIPLATAVTAAGVVTGVTDARAYLSVESPVTLGANLAAAVSLTGQALELCVQAKNTVFIGPIAGVNTYPTFRLLDSADIPDISGTYLTPGAHTAIGDSAPHHAAITLAASAAVLLDLTGQAISLDTQAANTVFAGRPAAGAALAPTFRALVALDLGTGAPDGTKYLRDDLTWQVPAAGGSMATDPLWAAKGDVAVGLANDSGGILTLTVPGAANLLNVLGVATAEDTPTYKVLYDATVPSAVGVASAGTGVVAARVNHVHAPGTLVLLADGTTPLTGNWVQSGAFAIRTAGYLRVGSSAAPTNVTAGDLNAARLFVGADAGITANYIADIIGALRVSTNIAAVTYARVGSSAAPTNVTAGDLTALRLSLGNAGAFGAAGYGSIVDVAHAEGNPGAGIYSTYTVCTTYGANSAATFKQNYAHIIMGAAAGNLNVVTAYACDIAHNMAGSITGVYGMNLNALVLDVNTPAAPGTVTSVWGMYLTAVYDTGDAIPATPLTVTNIIGLRVNPFIYGAAIALTCTTATGLSVVNPGAFTSLGTLVGLDIASLTRGTVNFGIRNASNLVQTGYARFGAVTAPTNVTAGDLNAIRLFVGANAAFTAGVTAAEFLGRCRIGSADVWLDQATITTIGNIATPAAGNVRQYIRSNADLVAATNFKTLWAKDENAFESSMSLRARSMWPLPITLTYSTSNVALASNDTTAHVGFVNVPFPIKVNKILFWISAAAGGATSAVRIAVYSENGQQKYIDATLVVGTTHDLETIDITDTTLAPGIYLVLICHSVYATSAPSITRYTYDTTLTAHIAGEPDWSGTLTIAGGAAPATIDPTALTTVANTLIPVLRFLGTALGS